MKITPKEFILKEFKDFEDMSHDDWLRKVQEYAVLSNSKINLDIVLEIASKKDDRYFALNTAIEALYFKDNSDYKNALYVVVKNLAQLNWDNIEDDTIKNIYYLLNPVS